MVSFIFFVVSDMEDYTVNWADGHKPHADPGSDNCVFREFDGVGSGAVD